MATSTSTSPDRTVIKVDPASVAAVKKPDREVIKLKPGDFITGKGEAALVGGAVKEGAKAIGRRLSTPETALRTIPPLALQTAGAVGGGYLGGEPGAMAGGAIASVVNDYYQRFLNHMYGVKNEPVSLSRELGSAGAGALFSEAPEALTGLRAANKVAQGAATKAIEENAATVGKQAEQQAGFNAEHAAAMKEHAAKQTQLAQKSLDKTADARATIQKQIDTDKAKLSEHIGKTLEAQRKDTAEQVGTQKVQGMLGKTPQQLAKQEAAPAAEFARQRAAAIDPVFSGAQQYHAEVGKAYEPYIGAHAEEELGHENSSQLAATVEQVKAQAAERGQNISSDTELKKIFDRIELAGEKPILSFGKHNAASNEQIAKLQARLETEAADGPSKPLTVGEAWGLRSRLGKVLTKSSNPSVRYAAHQMMDTITDMMPEVPDSVRQQYATERSQFPPSLMRQVATARNPTEVGAAIFGSPTAPEPAQVALNLIKRAKDPDQIEGLRTAFADNWLSKPHNPDDIGRFNPQVIKDLYGKDADDVFKLLGTEGSVKSVSWQKLIASSPEAKEAFGKAYSEAINSQKSQLLNQAITDGERMLREQPNKYKTALEAMKAAKTPEQKIAVLGKELVDPNQAAIDALGKRGLMPDSRLERAGLMGLGFRAMYAAAGSGGALAKHPDLAIGLSGMLGGRAITRLALSNPSIAKAYLKTISLDPSVSNATAIGNIIGQLTASAALQYAKENPILGVGEPGLSNREPAK